LTARLLELTPKASTIYGEDDLSNERTASTATSDVSKEATLKALYESIAATRDPNTTASDFRLRELEMDLGTEHIRDGDRVLDVGCGPGVAVTTYATRRRAQVEGLDYAANMVEFARERAAAEFAGLPVSFHHGSVTELPFADDTYDVVTSHRCLMALLDWNRQKVALDEIARVLKPGGTLVLMEGTKDGLDKLNAYRRAFSLSEIDAGGTDRLLTLKFDEKVLLDYVFHRFELLRVQRFGMYYFLTRIVQPLLVAPESPRYDHRLNEIARQIARVLPDFEGIGHLVGFCLRKRT